MFNILNYFKKKYYYPKIVDPQYTGYDLLVYEEIKKICESFSKSIEPTAPELIERSNSQLIWRISFRNKEDNFMKFNKSDDLSNDRYDGYIVYLNTEVFYLTCLNLILSSNTQSYTLKYIAKLRKDLSNDDKYMDAEKGFFHGFCNPVPLAYICAELDDEDKIFISFVNGITRTIWLIANYALSFPVYINGLDSATCLNDIAGLTDHPIQTKHLFDTKLFIK